MTGTPAILLLPGLASDDGPSMTRYARELHTALTHLRGPSGGIAIERPVQPRYVSRLIDHHQVRRVESAWNRYVAYPRSLRRRSAEVFHILDHGYAHLIRSLPPERTVVTCHDLIPLLAAEGVIPLRVPATVVRTFRWRIGHLARASAVIAVSHATKATLERYTLVRPEHITVVPQGVSPAFREHLDGVATTRAAAGLTEASAVLLQVATRGRYKNTSLLLHAFAAIRVSVGTSAMLVRIGAPLTADEAALAARLGVRGAIRDVGVVDEETLVQWYNAADVLVFPSSWEGFGWPPLEAMACGTPVVASDIPAVREVVDDSGLLVPPDDPAAMALAIERVLTDGVLAEAMRQKGLERAAHFTWARTALRTAAVYDAVNDAANGAANYAANDAANDALRQ